MDRRAVFGFFFILVLAGTACAAPFSVKVSVNGVDPAKKTAVVTAGEAADVSVRIDAESDDIVVDSVEINSVPSALGGILEAYIENSVEFPKELETTDNTNSYEVPGLVPAGDYQITALIHYSGGQSGTARYAANVRVENDGILSMILGLIMKILPKAIVKPIFGAVL
ncbi:MAG: hypothetical protein V1875_03095 [Candidatus Altiarchaeota archaeon]